MPLLGSQVQTRGALRILDTSTEQALREHPLKSSLVSTQNILFIPKIFCLYIYLFLAVFISTGLNPTPGSRAKGAESLHSDQDPQCLQPCAERQGIKNNSNG